MSRSVNRRIAKELAEELDAIKRQYKDANLTDWQASLLYMKDKSKRKYIL